MPPGHPPCRFPFPFFLFFVLSSFFFSLLSLSLFPFLFFRFVVFRSFLASPSSLFFSLPCSPLWRILISVISSRCYTPTALLASLQVCVFPLRAVFFLEFFFLPVFDFDLDIVCFILSFLWVLCCLLGFGFSRDSFSIRICTSWTRT